MSNDSSVNTGRKLFFNSITEGRDRYFVEYSPPVPTLAFATVDLVFLAARAPSEVAALMEKEATEWLQRYSIPIMVSASDDAESTIQLGSVRADNYLTAWRNAQGTVTLSWKPGDLDDFLREHPAKGDLREVYSDIPVRTEIDVKRDADAWATSQRRKRRLLLFVFGFWFALVPAAIALLEFFGPQWLGLIALGLALRNAWVAWAKLAGTYKPSEREKTEAERQRKMEHYYYHCEKNPAGFARLRSENFKAEARKRVRAEAADVARRNTAA